MVAAQQERKVLEYFEQRVTPNKPNQPVEYRITNGCSAVRMIYLSCLFAALRLCCPSHV